MCVCDCFSKCMTSQWLKSVTDQKKPTAETSDQSPLSEDNGRLFLLFLSHFNCIQLKKKKKFVHFQNHLIKLTMNGSDASNYVVSDAGVEFEESDADEYFQV